MAVNVEKEVAAMERMSTGDLIPQLVWLGVLTSATSRDEHAMRWYRHAIELGERYWDSCGTYGSMSTNVIGASINLGWLYVNHGMRSEAEEMYSRAQAAFEASGMDAAVGEMAEVEEVSNLAHGICQLRNELFGN